MQKHVTLAAVLNIVYRALHLFLAFGLFLLGLYFQEFMWAIMRMAHAPMHEIPFEIFGIVPMILVPISIIMMIVSIAGIAGGIGLLRHREWGRILLLVVSFFNLLRIPLGTMLGVYTLWVLMNDETIALFTPATVTVAPKSS